MSTFILLAAGRSSRYGTDKLLVPIRGLTLPQRAAVFALNNGGTRLCVTLSGRGGEAAPEHRVLADLEAVCPVGVLEVAWQDDQSYGTGAALSCWQGRIAEPAVVLFGDNFYAGTLPAFPDDEVLYLTTTTRNTIDEANLSLAAVIDGRVIEKPHQHTSGTYFTGLVRLPTGFLEGLDAVTASGRGELEITDLLNQTSSLQTLDLADTPLRWAELTRPEDKESVERAVGPLRGASGSILHVRGGELLKQCVNSERQVSWLRQERALLPGVRCVPTRILDQRTYVMPCIEGRVGYAVSGGDLVERLVDQVLAWRDEPADNAADWSSYLTRLADHATFVSSRIGHDAVRLLAAGDPFPASWCHGDLTLENVMLGTDGQLVLLDPNYAPDLYQSYLLDLGKILQSTHTDYHKQLAGHHVELATVDRALRDRLEAADLWQASLRACLSHLIRLLRHWPTQIDQVEAMIVTLLDELDEAS